MYLVRNIIRLHYYSIVTFNSHSQKEDAKRSVVTSSRELAGGQQQFLPFTCSVRGFPTLE
jgi:hypothetical protein